MKRNAWTLAPLIALLLSLPVFAKGLEEARFGEKITLKLQEASAKNVFSTYRDLLGVTLDYACDEDKKITFAFENVTVKTSLDALCESAGLQWKILNGDPPILRIDCAPASPGLGLAPVAEHKPAGTSSEHAGKIRIYEPETAKGEHPPYKIDVTLQDADLDKVLGMMAKVMDARLLVDASLSGRKVSLNMKRATLEEVLDAACAQAKAKWQLREGEGRLLTVDPAR